MKWVNSGLSSLKSHPQQLQSLKLRTTNPKYFRILEIKILLKKDGSRKLVHFLKNEFLKNVS